MKTFIFGLVFGGMAAVGGTQYTSIVEIANQTPSPASISCAVVVDDVFEYATYDRTFRDVDCYYENGSRSIVGPTCAPAGDGWAAHMEGFTDICEVSRRSCSFTCEATTNMADAGD